jgi:hypothetical protein
VLLQPTPVPLFRDRTVGVDAVPEQRDVVGVVATGKPDSYPVGKQSLHGQSAVVG